MDFVNNLDPDMSLAILSCLNDPSDLVRVSTVSRSWREFVIANSLSKNLCLRLFQQLTCVGHISEPNSNDHSSEAAGSSSSTSLMMMMMMMDTSLEKDHRAYALLARGCTSSPIKSCIADAIVASSTDNFPAESILNTLEERDRIAATPSYWSSKGHHKTTVPETLLYKLEADLCVITEFNIQPFQAYFQRGSPIYSSHYVRFRLGHLNDDKKGDEAGKIPAETNYVWTYTSQEFPMAQENRLQNFKLPEPVICIGGYMLMEFLGRVQTQRMDGLYYICMAHVNVMGRSLAKSFRVVKQDDNGKFRVKVVNYNDPQEIEAEAGQNASFRSIRDLEQLLNILKRHPVDAAQYVWPE
ncbi:unnamed protein product [Cochlearia groenlandica]